MVAATVDDPHLFRSVPSQFFIGRFEELGRCATAERLQP